MPELPKEFLQSIACCAGYDETAFIHAHQQDIPVSIRLNPFKPADIPHLVKAPVSWCQQAFYLEQRPNFTRDLSFQAGCYYVQEAGSMFLDHVLRSQGASEKALTVLDLCAAPGGKSTLALSAMHPDGVLVSNEVIKPRAEILSQNLSKWGICNSIVTNADPRDFSELQATFDIILVDAPCSGSGLFRKQEDAIEEWSSDLVNLCSQRQKRILSDVLPALKPGGLLIYSTCSYSTEENEAVADWLVSEYPLHSERIELQSEWGIVESQSDRQKAYGYRFYPNRTVSEGFYCAVFRHDGNNSENNHQQRSKKNKTELASKKELAVIEHYVSCTDDHPVVKFKEDFLLMNPATMEFMTSHPRLYMKKAGTRIGSIIRDELVPNHDLALSIHVSQRVNRIEADEETLIRFMKKELFTADGAKGWNLMTHKGYGLGWIKHLGNRINNYLPNEFRILN